MNVQSESDEYIRKKGNLKIG